MATTFYKLKDFARITNLSRKALLLYEENGLLIPEKVAQQTGYRYYSNTQIQKASIFSLLRNFEVPLKDLKSITDGTVSIVDYFERSNKRVELTRNLAKIHHALSILSLCEKSNSFFSSNLETTILPKKAILYSEAWCAIKEIPLYFALIYRYMVQNAIVAVDHSFTWYFKDSTKNKVHMKMCCPVSGFFETGHKEIKCEIFHEMKVARLRHFGDYSTLGETYRMLNEGIEKEELKRTGETIETYIVTGDTRYCDSSIFVTDIAGVLI